MADMLLCVGPTCRKKAADYENANKELQRSLPLLYDTHGELEEHVQALSADHNNELREKATSLLDSLGRAKVWVMHRDGDLPSGNLPSASPENVSLYKNPLAERLPALRHVQKEVEGELRKNPKVVPPKRPLLGRASEKMATFRWGGRGRQDH